MCFRAMERLIMQWPWKNWELSSKTTRLRWNEWIKGKNGSKICANSCLSVFTCGHFFLSRKHFLSSWQINILKLHIALDLSSALLFLQSSEILTMPDEVYKGSECLLCTVKHTSWLHHRMCLSASRQKNSIDDSCKQSIVDFFPLHYIGLQFHNKGRKGSDVIYLGFIFIYIT